MSSYDGWLHESLYGPYDGALHSTGPTEQSNVIVISGSGVGLSQAAAEGVVSGLAGASGVGTAYASSSGEGSVIVNATGGASAGAFAGGVDVPVEPEPVESIESGGATGIYGPVSTSITAKIPVEVLLLRRVEGRFPVESSMVRGVESRLGLSSTTICPFETRTVVLRLPAETYSLRLREDDELLLSLIGVA